MTAVASAVGVRPWVWTTPVALTLGTIGLVARRPGAGGVVLVCLVGLIGLLAPIPGKKQRASPATYAAATALGMGLVYLVGRLGQPPEPVDLVAIIASLAAAVGEEAFFRRLMYGWLARRGALLAVGGAALAFAAVHLPLYGLAPLPLNLAAGLLFGWQRWATGGWESPALTHALANLIGSGVLA